MAEKPWTVALPCFAKVQIPGSPTKCQPAMCGLQPSLWLVHFEAHGPSQMLFLNMTEAPEADRGVFSVPGWLEL